MLENRNAKPGILDNNPIHEDMLNACGMVGLDYIVNVVLNSRNEIARCFSGESVSDLRLSLNSPLSRLDPSVFSKSGYLAFFV
jgi:nickel-dependent lactate racemase